VAAAIAAATIGEPNRTTAVGAAGQSFGHATMMTRGGCPAVD
jgi:hypothetical protein